jgi:hypothetical protein
MRRRLFVLFKQHLLLHYWHIGRCEYQVHLPLAQVVFLGYEFHDIGTAVFAAVLFSEVSIVFTYIAVAAYEVCFVFRFAFSCHLFVFCGWCRGCALCQPLLRRYRHGRAKKFATAVVGCFANLPICATVAAYLRLVVAAVWVVCSAQNALVLLPY